MPTKVYLRAGGAWGGLGAGGRSAAGLRGARGARRAGLRLRLRCPARPGGSVHLTVVPAGQDGAHVKGPDEEAAICLVPVGQ